MSARSHLIDLRIFAVLFLVAGLVIVLATIGMFGPGLVSSTGYYPANDCGHNYQFLIETDHGQCVIGNESKQSVNDAVNRLKAQYDAENTDPEFTSGRVTGFLDEVLQNLIRQWTGGN